MTVIDKPRIRVPARTQRMSTNAEIETSYHAASLTARDMSSWNPWRVSPDTALLSELDTIVARSDDLTRNNGIASGAERTLIDNVIGPRISCKPNPDRIAIKRDADWASAWSAKVESQFSTFADTVWFDAGLRHTFHSASRLVLRTLSSSGEALVLPLWLTHAGSKWNTALQLIDPARLSNPNGRMDSATMRGGIELDGFGAAVAYNIRKTHPGDMFGGFFGLGGGEWERIPAYMPWGRSRVLHVFDQERIGQTRGKPLVTAVARQFKMLDHFMREKLRLAVLNAMIFATLETPLDQEAQVELFGGDKTKDYQSQMAEWRVQMKGGAIVPTPPGTTLNSFIPPSTASDLDSFTTVMLRYIATGLNLPYELVFKDFSKSNYSSARAALLEAWRYFLACRQLLADSWWSPVFELWFEEAVNRGEIEDCTPDDFYSNRIAWTRCKWICAGRGWVDPVKEADAAGIRMDKQMSTLEDECAEQGKDWRVVLEQQARENALRTELGLPIPGATVAQQNYPTDAPQQTQAAA
jgi:lambda family phage portal protein